MVKFSYDYIEAPNEKELRKRLIQLQMSTGFTYRIINIYPSGNKVVAWYYSDKRVE